MSSIIIKKFGPSALQILDAALAIAANPSAGLDVESTPESGSIVFGGAEFLGRREKDYTRGLGYLAELKQRTNIKNQVFLGGACGIPWRNEIAIPILKHAGCQYFNPEVDDWEQQDALLKAGGLAGGIVELEAVNKDQSAVLLFVFDPKTRAIATLNECVEYMSRGAQKVVIVSAYVNPGQDIGGQELTVEEAMDINIARAKLFGIAAGKGVLVFDNIDGAVWECAADLMANDQDHIIG